MSAQHQWERRVEAYKRARRNFERDELEAIDIPIGRTSAVEGLLTFASGVIVGAFVAIMIVQWLK